MVGKVETMVMCEESTLLPGCVAGGPTLGIVILLASIMGSLHENSKRPTKTTVLPDVRCGQQGEQWSRECCGA